MLTVHHLGVSQSERIVWLCEELGIPYELKRYDRDPASGLAPAAYRELHPMGVAPVVSDGDLVLAESGAIIEYILGRYGAGGLAPSPDDASYASYLFWFHFANGTLMPSLTVNMLVASGGASIDHPIVRTFCNRTDRSYAMIESRLGEVPWLAGEDFTAADIMTVFALTTLRAFVARDLGASPNIRAYLRRIGERPAYQRAMAKGDPSMELMLQ